MNFDKKFSVYDEYADVQKKVAENLMDFIGERCEEKNIAAAFEIGCGTGLFSKVFQDNLNPDIFILNDFYDVREFVKDIKYEDFIAGDIEKADLPEVDMIVSSSCLQWVKDFEALVKKIADSCEVFSFSIYIEGNLCEIKDHFNVSLSYMSVEELRRVLCKYFKEVEFDKETIVKRFSSPLAALRNLKNTGVTGECRAGIREMRSFKRKILTYEVAYFYCSKNAMSEEKNIIEN